MAILTCLLYAIKGFALPAGFTYVTDPRIILEINYATNDNFIGRPINGYKNKVCILTKQAAAALLAVQDELDTMHKSYRLRIYDSYRPTTAVADFVQWSNDPHDQMQKATYYPDLNKPDLFKLGYIFARSSHSRGSTVDLTIEGLDMGTAFDFFSEASHTDSKLVSETAQQNRLFFKTLMAKHGFINIPQEWWHFTLHNEPFPDHYFDFAVG